MAQTVLEVRDLAVEFMIGGAPTSVVQDISFSIEAGKVLGVVGESGCGKSVTATAIMGLLPEGLGRVSHGSIRLLGDELVGKTEREMREIRGNQVAMIFQDPMTSLDPMYTIGDQMVEQIRAHDRRSRQDAWEYARHMLEQVGIPSPGQRLHEYPHQLSGGMRQRVMIAMALSCKPALLIADEPTTALDVTIQAEILDLIKDLQRDFETAVLMITHDMGVVAQTADDVMVMYAGSMVETSSAVELFHHPKHPYTRGLIASIPPLRKNVDRLHTIPGAVPALSEMPAGCRFCDRCSRRAPACEQHAPRLRPVDGGARVRCDQYERIEREVAAWR